MFRQGLVRWSALLCADFLAKVLLSGFGMILLIAAALRLLAGQPILSERGDSSEWHFHLLTFLEILCQHYCSFQRSSHPSGSGFTPGPGSYSKPPDDLTSASTGSAGGSTRTCLDRPTKEIANEVQRIGGFVPKTCWIAHVKSEFGLSGTEPNRRKEREVPVPTGKAPGHRGSHTPVGNDLTSAGRLRSS